MIGKATQSLFGQILQIVDKPEYSEMKGCGPEEYDVAWKGSIHLEVSP